MLDGWTGRGYPNGASGAPVNDVDRELQARLDAAYDAQGVDRSLIRACLAQSPAQRLADLESQLRFFESAERNSQGHRQKSGS